MIIPNNEIKSVFRNKVIESLIKSYAIKNKFLDDAADKLYLVLQAEKEEEIKIALSNFKTDFEEYLKSFPKFRDIKKMKQDERIDEPFLQANESTIRDLIVPMVFRIDPIFRGTEVENKNNRNKSDIAFVCNKTNKCVILEIKFNQTVDDAIDQIKKKKYENVFEGYLENKTYTPLLLGINVFSDKGVDIKQHIVNKDKDNKITIKVNNK